MSWTSVFHSFLSDVLSNQNSKNSKDLIQKLSSKSPNDQLPTVQLCAWLNVLAESAPRLSPVHAPLVAAALSVPWAAADSVTARTYTRFVGHLVSARPEYLPQVLSIVAQGFTYESLPPPQNVPGPPPPRRVVYGRVHALLAHILALIPTAPTILATSLSNAFPHKRRPPKAHSAYVRNLLRARTYCPALATRILALVVHRAVQIDVEIQAELDEIEGQVFEIDTLNTNVGDDASEDGSLDSHVEGDDDAEDDSEGFSDISSEEDNDDKPALDIPSEATHLHAMAHKLDIILSLLFTHLQGKDRDSPPSFESPSNSAGALDLLPDDLEPTLSPTLFHTDSRSDFLGLLSIFERTILPTFRTRFVQFLLFVHCSRDPDASDLFQGLLVARALALDGPAPPVVRAAAAAYIGGFVARAKCVKRTGARRVARVLCSFLDAQIDAPPEEPTVFGAVSQAMFLIFCFRWRDLRGMDDSSAASDDEDVIDDLSFSSTMSWLPELDALRRAVSSPFTPLRTASPAVAAQFTRIAHATGFIYAYPYLNIPSVNGVLPSAGFFPFDPYTLPRSVGFVRGVYREWGEVAVGVGDSESESDSEDSDGEGDEIDHSGEEEGWSIPMAVKGIKSDGELGRSLGAMSISA